VRRVLSTIIPVLLAGCASTRDWSKEPLPISVSAANYSESSSQDLFQAMSDRVNAQPSPPAVPVPDRPIFYGFVPGEVYDSNLPLEAVYQELAIGLAHRGYFNVVYEARAGYLPKRVDYLLRVHCGVRRWAIPSVRAGHVTWGNSGLVSNDRDPHSVNALIYGVGDSAFGVGQNPDPRAGQDPMYAINVATYLQSVYKTSNDVATNAYSVRNLSDYGTTRDYCLVVVEAFRFEDVMKKKRGAPCVWATFIAVPIHAGQEFSQMLRSMVRTGTPYFGTTTDGIQEYDLPAGKVLVGEPVEVSGPQPAH
jgi:hypothetical protein